MWVSAAAADDDDDDVSDDDTDIDDDVSDDDTYTDDDDDDCNTLVDSLSLLYCSVLYGRSAGHGVRFYFLAKVGGRKQYLLCMSG